MKKPVLSYFSLFSLLVFLLSFEVIGQALPPGLGWQALPNTQMMNSCPANDPHGACGNMACSIYTEFDYKSSCDYIILPWSGGVGDDLNQRLYVFGGGHVDYGGNQLMALDLRGTPSWELFRAPDKVAYPKDNNNNPVDWESYNPYVERGDSQHYPRQAAPRVHDTPTLALFILPCRTRCTHSGAACMEMGIYRRKSGR